MGGSLYDDSELPWSNGNQPGNDDSPLSGVLEDKGRATEKRELSMERAEVKSSSIRSAGYDPKTGKLEVEFMRGTVYSYFGVPQSVYDGLLAAESAGKYFQCNIRNNYTVSKA